MGYLWLNGWGIYDLMGGAFDLMGGAFMAWMSVAVMATLLFFEICSRIAGLQGSALSRYCMTTDFAPFEFLTCGLLQRG